MRGQEGKAYACVIEARKAKFELLTAAEHFSQ
jgi:hypothetical protein